MSRRRRQAKRQITDDPIYGLKSVSKFINALMIGGKKTTAEKIFYNSFDLIKNKALADINLVNGIILTGTVIKFDNFSILVEQNYKTTLIYKHSISYILLKNKKKNKK